VKASESPIAPVRDLNKSPLSNLLLMTDSYKFTHWRQYPPGTERVYSYVESRGGMFKETVFFGLQYYLKHYLQGSVFIRENIDEADHFCREHFGREGYFNRVGWLELFERWGGRLPLEIKAVPEGTVVPVSNVMLTVENTDPRFPWLTNYLETLLLKVWYPITVATLSREIKRVFLMHLERTGDPSTVAFKLHDFGYRGVSSEETAALGAAAHLVNFQGTDTVAGIQLLRGFYGTHAMPAFSVPAAEHSTITAWGREHECDAYANMLNQFPEGIVACVSDSYDVFNACEHIWGEQLRDKVLSRNGVLVIRPDSGDPKTVVLKVLEILGEKFGFQVNHKGYKVLDPKVRIIQGDGVNYWTIQDVLTSMSRAGWSADNISFGMGGALLQQLNRDTQKFAFKCSNITVAGKDRVVFKEPVTDAGKGQKRGRLALTRRDGHLETILSGRQTGKSVNNLLETVFMNGEIKHEFTLEQIRQRAELNSSKLATKE
jgi:nicotinamide phosphoribosyltransferase